MKKPKIDPVKLERWYAIKARETEKIVDLKKQLQAMVLLEE